MTQPQFKLNVEQATLAFDILDILHERFPDNPELVVEPLKVVLHAIETTLEEDNGNS